VDLLLADINHILHLKDFLRLGERVFSCFGLQVIDVRIHFAEDGFIPFSVRVEAQHIMLLLFYDLIFASVLFEK
jgi:hypothetical protein